MKKTDHSTIKRRDFIGGVATAALAFTIVPRHVLGGPDFVAPSDKLTMAYIGMGTQGIREMLVMLQSPKVQIVAICDSNKSAVGYRDWGKDYLKNEVRKLLNDPNWQPGGENIIPGGRDCGKDIVDKYYALTRAKEKYKGCNAYEDFRELFEKEKDINSVKIMTPDHLHGIMAMAALKRGKHITMHKPIANRLVEGKEVIELAKKTNVTTHMCAWDSNGNMQPIMDYINGGAIGKLKEIHTWTNRPVWPQYPTLPTDSPPVPDGFNWDLWLGPEKERPYHPNYTNMTFRGWYDFGGGSMADMGYYGLWTVFNALQLEAPTIIEPNFSHFCGFNEMIPFRVRNDFSFPIAAKVRFRYPAKGARPAVDLFWYDGGMRPAVPDELYNQNKELPAEGMMFVGEEGTILSGFHVDNPRIISGKRAGESVTTPRTEGGNDRIPNGFIDAALNGKQCAGSFRDSWPITETANLYAAALRAGRTLYYDAVAMKITNHEDSNKYLTREYRKGFELSKI